MLITEKSTNKRNFLQICVTVFLLVSMLFTAALPIAADYPKKDENVADEAKVLSETTVRSLRKTNETLKADLGVSIAVCTVNTTGETPIDEYAAGLFKSWRLGDGILLLIAVEDEDYYFLQSKGVEKLITNDDLAAVRDSFLEDDFAAGNIDRGVLKTVTQLNSLLVSALEESAEAETGTEENAEESEENEGTTIGSVIVSFFKFLLGVVLVAIIAFVALFIAAMFNDDCAEFMRTYIFRRGQSNKTTYNYDERLYGGQNRSRSQGSQQRRSDPYAQNRQILEQRRTNPAYNPHRTSYGGQLNYDEYNRQQNNTYGNARQNYGGQNYARQQGGAYRDQSYGYRDQNYGYRDQGYGYQNNSLPQGQNRQYSSAQQNRTYYNADGTQRQNRPQRPQNNVQAQNGGYPRQQRQYQQYSDDAMNGDETRAFTIPGRDSN